MDLAGESAPRILIVRLGAMGDIIHALPAVAMLRRELPAAILGWVVEQRWAALLSTAAGAAGPRSEQKPLVDLVHTVNTLAWRRALLWQETWRQVAGAIAGLRRQHYDVALDFQGAFKSAFLAQLSQAPRRIGFAQPREKPATLFYTHQVQAGGRHVIEQNLSLAAAIAPGVPSRESRVPSPESRVASPESRVPSRESRVPSPESRVPEVCFPLPRDSDAERVCEQQLGAHGVGEFAILTPGAGWGAKCWPAERYAAVARALCADGLRSIINYGPGEEDLARAVEKGSGGAAVAITCGVGELIACTRRARLFIGGDTGPMHLAAALGVPVVALFGPTDPARNGPFGGHKAVLRHASSETRSSHRPQPDQGLLRITAEEVIAAARSLVGVRR